MVLPLAASLTRSEEWEAGVILATMALTVVFAVLSVLAVSIHITSKGVEWWEGRKKPAKPKHVPPARMPKPLRKEDLLGAAIAAASMHHTLKIAGAVAALHHHIKHLPVRRSALREVREGGLNAWFLSWLNEASLRPDINPYLKTRMRGESDARNI